MVVTPTRRWSCRISCRRWTRTFASRADKRLVQQEQAGRGRERARERDALLLAARQLGRVLVALLGQADQLEELPHAGPDRRARHPRVLEPVGDVLRRRQVREQRVGLEDDPEVAPRGRQRGDVPAGLLDAPARLRVQTRDRAQERGLPASGRPEEADELALVDVERDAVECRELTELLRELADAEERGGRGGGGDRHREGSVAASARSGGAGRHGGGRPLHGTAARLPVTSSARTSRRTASPTLRGCGRDWSAAHWKSFFAMCWVMLAGRCSTGLAIEGIAVTA